MMINCEEAAHICTKSQYSEASFLEKIKLKLHWAMCKTCKGFSKKNARLTKLCEQAEMHSLSDSEKKAIKEKVIRES
ncbi:MAG: hypothetical protein AB3N16_14540 [Flavobacteriaceae bacterium]